MGIIVRIVLLGMAWYLMAYYVGVSLATLAAIGLFGYMAFNSAGGYPEALYRLRNIDYYQFYIFLPNRKIDRPLVKAGDLKIGSAARFEYKISKDKTGDYFLPQDDDKDAWFTNPHGAPAAEYNWDDTRPIPVFGREPDAIGADGRRIVKAKADATLVHSAFKNDFLERRAKLNVKPPKIGGITLLLIGIIFILALATVFYTYYFGYNMNCALHTKACP